MTDQARGHKDADIAVLLGTHNGARHLGDQLASIARQHCGGMTLYVSDDGSSDRTGDILSEFGEKESVEVVRLEGPCRGFAENYRHLLRMAGEEHDYYLFSDQDDIWHDDRVSRSIAAIETVPGKGPLVACSRTLNIDETGRSLGMSPLFSRPPSFRNALVQSIAGGNTMTLNREAYALVRTSAGKGPFVSHDWWTYIIVTAAGGQVLYLNEPTVSYRQHGDNIVGANSGIGNRARRLWRGFHGTYRDWNRVNVALLERNLDLMTEDSREVLDLFHDARTGALPRRVAALRKSGVYRQTTLSDASLYLACVLGKI